jgi:hypothetical protein
MLKPISVPRHFSIRPILIHVNGVDDVVLDEGYFDKVIDFGQLLEKKFDPKIDNMLI